VRAWFAVLALAGACGDDPVSPEVVVADAGSAPQVLGASSTTVFWATGTATERALSGAAVASLPATETPLGIASGPVAHAGDFLVYVGSGLIQRVDGTGDAIRVSGASTEAVGVSADGKVVVWTDGANVEWATQMRQMATLTKIDRCDHALVTSEQIYLACDGTTGRRLLRIEIRTAEVTGITSSTTWAAMFPSPMPTATYKGRIVGGDNEGVLWLVEESPSRRAILVHEAIGGEPTVLLEHVKDAARFFTTDDALYWQEGDELLTAARNGGEASIVATLPGAAGGIADGYVYFAHDNAIERLRVE